MARRRQARRAGLIAREAAARGVPIRVGANAGSLEKEVMDRHGGPTAAALVDQAMREVKLLEDADFHDYQELEGALRQYTALRPTRPLAARRALVAMARFEAAHCPTSRAMRQTYQIALRLQRGEELYQEEE